VQITEAATEKVFMDSMVCGIIPVNKAEGFTSFDVCAVIRRAVGTKRVGHTGTLDPMATGVLPVLVGRATLAADILPNKDKAYRAELVFGTATDTFDSSGRVTDTSDKRATLKVIADKLSFFNTPRVIAQLPPMYSAVKVGGKKLYELARKGIETERTPRQITIYEARLENFDEASQTAAIFVKCSAGTYIRTFIDDLGRDCGTYAHMTALLRVYANGIDIKDCVSILDIKADSSLALKSLRPVESLFEKLPLIEMDDETFSGYRNGVKSPITLPDGRYRIKHDGEFIGTGTVFENTLKAEKYFVI
jgi:tRNA pseudouridine55 synthase